MPTRIVIGEGTLSHLPELVGDAQARVLVVCGAGAMRRSGVLDQVKSLLGTERTYFYEGIQQNPTPEQVDSVVDVFRREKCQVVIGLGGGSVLDVAKSVAILHASEHGTWAHLSGKAKLEKTGTMCIAVPTTSGTGSEVTPWATIWEMESRRKYSLTHPSMFPTAALVDPLLTMTLPPVQTALSGMDALTQAIEAYWARKSQPMSEMYALAAVRKIINNLEDACLKGETGARVAMAEGSLLSGLAFSNTQTTVCHSLSYPMTAHFGVPHGQAVSITLGAFLEWNAESIADKLPFLLEALSAQTTEDASDQIRLLMTKIGLSTDFRSLGLTEPDLDVILEEGFEPQRSGNNPRPVTVDNVRELLQSLI